MTLKGDVRDPVGQPLLDGLSSWGLFVIQYWASRHNDVRNTAVPLITLQTLNPLSQGACHAERLGTSGGEVIPGRSEGYIIWQNERLIEKAQTYDEATRKGKVVKRRHPEAKVEIQYSSVTVELK